jgi:orotate phosphoribosyltransferase
MGDKRQSENALARILVKTGAIKFGTFTLTSGKVSPYYLDLRLIPSFPQEFGQVIRIMILKLRELRKRGVKVDRIGGVPTAGIPFASGLGYELGIPFLYVRKEPRTHGRERRIEGVLSPGDKIVLVDEMVTTGNSLGEAAETLRAEGGLVENALVIVDREEGATRNLRQRGVRLHSLATMSVLSKRLLFSKVIDSKQYETITSQLETD